MKTKFLVEAQSTSPKFSLRVETTKGLSKSVEITIFPSVGKDVTFNGVAHRDNVYNNKTAKCKDLDCSEFYSSARTTGQVSLCGDCLPKRTRPPGSKPYGCGSGVALQNFTVPDNIRVTNQTNGEVNYSTWLTGQGNQQIAKSSYWLGLNNSGGMCGPPFQCIVGCQSGSVAGCWDTSKGGSGNFGDIYSINGSTYQVYDPIQIHLAGISSNGGSLPLLSGNPIQGLTPVSGFGTVTCGPIITVVHPGGGSGPGSSGGGNNGSDGDTNVIIRGSGNDSHCSSGSSFAPSNLYSPTVSLDAFPSAFGLYGNYFGKTICTATDCYLPNQSDGLTLDAGKYRFGGSTAGIPLYNLQDWQNENLGLTGSMGGLSVHNTPGEGLEYIITQSYNRTKTSSGNAFAATGDSGGPTCCQFSSGGLSINGAPNLNASTNSWGAGSGTWNNFWSNSKIDDFYRDPFTDPDPNIKGWQGCGGTQTTANSLYTTPCRPVSKCGPGGGGGNYLLMIGSSIDSQGDCCGAQGYGNGVCSISDVTICGQTGPGTSIFVSALPCSSIKYISISGVDENGDLICSSDDCGGDTSSAKQGCKLPCNVHLLAGATKSGETETVKDVSDAMGAAMDSECGNSIPYTIKTDFGCSNKLQVTGESSNCAFPEGCGPAYITSTGYVDVRTVATWKAQGLSVAGASGPDGQGVGSYSGGNCCSQLYQTPNVVGGDIDVPMVCDNNDQQIGEDWFVTYLQTDCGCGG